MTVYMNWAHISRRLGRLLNKCVVGLLLVTLVAGCSLPALPQSLPELPKVPEWTGLPADLGEVQDLLSELGLPDLSSLGDVPGLDALPSLTVPAGAFVLQGPLEIGLSAGDRIPGTDIALVAPGADSARFRIAGMEATRRTADSLDFDGAWPGIDGVDYTLRLRVYRLTDRQVRAAGVQRLVIRNVQPQQAAVTLSGHVMRFPHSVAADTGGTFAGMTLGYRGSQDRGGELSGLAEGEYPFRKVGDSVEWQGRLRADLPVEYRLRMLYYQDSQARLGGVALLSLPAP